jgi:VWFA-related protein
MYMPAYPTPQFRDSEKYWHRAIASRGATFDCRVASGFLSRRRPESVRRDAVLLIAIVAIGAVLVGRAQQVPVFRASADIVQIDVSVLGRDRQPVHGLRAADFTVLDEGIEQPVVAFAAVDLPDRVRTGAPWTVTVAPDVVTNHLGAQRVVLVLFDDCSTPWDPSVLQVSRRIAKAAVDELGLQDLASVIYTSARRNGQELTNDRVRLMAAVERFVPQSPAGSAPAGPFSASRPTGGLLSGADGTVRIPSGNCLSGSAGSPLDQALRNAAEILSAWPGARKTVILVSTSAPDFSTMTLDHNVLVDNLGRTFAAMQRANLNVYQFDPRGLEVGRKVSEEFGILSDNTGGRAFTNTNTPWEGVPQVFRENSSYYLLGFRPTTGTQDRRFRKITVKVSRPGLEVRTRAGYYAAPPEQPQKPSTKPTPTAIERALSNGLPTGDVPLSLSAVAAPVAGRKDPAVAVVAGLGAVDHAPEVERIEMTAAAFTDTWKSAGTVTQTIEVSTAGVDSRRAMTDVPLRLDLKPGRYEIRLAVHSVATGRTGSVYASLTVPDFAKAHLGLSGAQLVRNGVGSSDPAATALSLPWPPGVTTRRTFRRAEAVSAVVRISQIGASRPGLVTITTIIQNREGAEVSRDTRELPSELFEGSRIVEHRATLPLAQLQAGEYLLTFEARSRNQIEQGRVRFTVDGL